MTPQIEPPVQAPVLIANRHFRSLLQALVVAVGCLLLGLVGDLWSGANSAIICLLVFFVSFAGGELHEYLVRRAGV